jgi:xylan 1,4-beta-xylosidase
MKTQSSFEPPRPLAIAAVAVAAAAAILANAGTAHAASFTITVDASKQTANPHFWSAAFGTGTASLTLRSDLQTHYKIGNRELGMLRVRGHGVLNDDMGVYKGPGSYDWTKFDTYLNAIVSAGMRPIMELSFMPTALAKNGNSRDVPKDYAAYKQFIQAVVQHCVDKYGAPDVGQWYWEVWNEYDYSGFWNGTAADYYTLYDNAVDGATAVLPNILIGGPASTEPGKIAAFLQHCKTANKRVTFASSHVYPGGAAAGAVANATGLVNDNNTRIQQIMSGGYTTAQVKSFNTEWNSSYNGQGGLTGDVVTSMDNHWNVGFILKGVKLLADKTSGDTPALDVFSYWTLSDVFDESSGPSGSYILGQGGNLPFGRVFGVMTFQGMRKASFNAFKMLNYLGPKRLASTGGASGDGVDVMAAMSAAGDEIQILVYNYYQMMNTTGSDSVTVTINNIPSTLAGKSVFGTQFLVDETHSNPYNTWVSQNKPTAPTEAQWQAMKAHQGLEMPQAVGKTTLGATFTTSITLNRQAGTLLIIGLNRPVTGRNALVEIEGEDYDGQSGANKEDSNDIGLGQSLSVGAGGSFFFNNVDFSDAGVGSVQLRVNAAGATTLTLRTDSQTTGTVIGTCNVAATAGAWATQTCTLAQTTGVHTLYATAAGALRVNYLKFLPGGSTTGTGGMGGGAGGRGGAGGATGTGGTTGAGGSTSPGAGGSSNPGSGGSTSPGAGGTTGSGGDGSGVAGSGGPGIGGMAGSDSSGSGGSGSGGDTGAGGSSIFGNGGSNGGVAGTSGSGGSAPPASGGGGCGCAVGDAGGAPGTLLIVGLVATVLGARRQRARRR